MTDSPAAGLERAIEARATRLADDERRIGREQAERIARESGEKLARLEAREREASETAATREYRRIVQAEELHQHATLDRLRGGIVESVLEAARERLAALADDADAAREVLVVLLGDAVAELGEGPLVASLNETDRLRFEDGWAEIVEAACPGRDVALARETCPCAGGVLVTGGNGDVRLDNTFGGRLARLDGDLRRLVHETLFRTTASMESAFRG